MHTSLPILGILSILLTVSLCEEKCKGVFCVQPISEDCTGNCGTLTFFDSSGKEIVSVQGTDKNLKHDGSWGIRNVAKVQQVGTGCYKISVGRRHKGQSYTVKGLAIKDLEEEGYGSMKLIRSVRYDISCGRRMATVTWWIPVVSVAAVILLGIAIFLGVKGYRRRYGVVSGEDSGA